MNNFILKQKLYFSLVILALAGISVTSVNFLYHNKLSVLLRPLSTFAHKIDYNGGAFNYLSANVLNYNQNKVNSLFTVKSYKESKTIPVFVYHGITEKADRFSMNREAFKDQMFALKKAGYQTITLKEFEEAVLNNGKVPANSFLLTFDDGRIDSYVEADPILEALGFTAVMYISTQASLEMDDDRKSTYYLAEEDIRKMLATGRWEIGSHAIQETGGFIPVENGQKANFLSNRKWLEQEGRVEDDVEYLARLEREIMNSKEILESTFKVPVNTFSYPFGDYGQQTINNRELATSSIAQMIEQTYSIAFKQTWPNDGDYITNYLSEDENRIKFKRFETPTNWTGAEMVSFMNSISEKNILNTFDLNENAGWKQTWGSLSFENGNLVLKTKDDTTGAMMFMDGTRSWDNYIVLNTFEWIMGGHVSILARYKDSNNYLSCNFSDEYVRIDQYVNGNVKQLVQVKNFVEVEDKSDMTLGVVVKDDFMQCVIDGSVVTYATIPDGEGGFGVKIWDENVNNAEIRIKNVISDFSFNSSNHLKKKVE